MDAKKAERAAKWILKSTLSSDTIAAYLGIIGEDKKKLRATTRKLREEQEKARC